MRRQAHQANKVATMTGIRITAFPSVRLVPFVLMRDLLSAPLKRRAEHVPRTLARGRSTLPGMYTEHHAESTRASRSRWRTAATQRSVVLGSRDRGLRLPPSPPCRRV